MTWIVRRNEVGNPEVQEYAFWSYVSAKSFLLRCQSREESFRALAIKNGIDLPAFCYTVYWLKKPLKGGLEA